MNNKVLIYKLKLFNLIAVAVFYVYLGIRSIASSNWDKSRAVGFSQKGRCDLPGSRYFISDSIMTYYNATLGITVPLKIPFVFQVPLTSPNSGDLCFTIKGFDNCVESVFSGYPFTSLNLDKTTALFDSKTNSSYFPYSSWIVLCTILSILFSQSFQTSIGIWIFACVRRTNISNHWVLKMLYSKFSDMLAIVVVGLLWYSSASFITVNQLNCELTFNSYAYLTLNTDAKKFCSRISSCDAVVMSDINTTEFVIRDYGALSVVFGFGVLVSTMMHVFSSQLQENYLPENSYEIPPGYHSYEEYLNSADFERSVVEQWRRNQAAQNQPLITPAAIAVKQRQLSRHWKDVTRSFLADINCRDAICPICITPYDTSKISDNNITNERVNLNNEGVSNDVLTNNETVNNVTEPSILSMPAADSVSINLENNPQISINQRPATISRLVNNIDPRILNLRANGILRRLRPWYQVSTEDVNNVDVNRNNLNNSNNININHLNAGNETVDVIDVRNRRTDLTINSNNLIRQNNNENGGTTTTDNPAAVNTRTITTHQNISESIIVEVPCHHIFHKSCLLEWIKTNSSCPICRAFLGIDASPTIVPVSNDD